MWVFVDARFVDVDEVSIKFKCCTIFLQIFREPTIYFHFYGNTAKKKVKLQCLCFLFPFLFNDSHSATTLELLSFETFKFSTIKNGKLYISNLMSYQHPNGS